jgi:thioredoxin reductase
MCRNKIFGRGGDLDEMGYVKTGLLIRLERWMNQYSSRISTMTNVEGLFAAGDCVDFRYRQVQRRQVWMMAH